MPDREKLIEAAARALRPEVASRTPGYVEDLAGIVVDAVLAAQATDPVREAAEALVGAVERMNFTAGSVFDAKEALRAALAADRESKGENE